MRTVVVLPTYNEAENITGMLNQIAASPIQTDILVVDDSSPDGTGRLVEAFQEELPGRVHLLTRTSKEGLGAAYRAGFAEALRLGYDIVVQMDADGSHPVTALTAMRAQIDAGVTLSIGSRYCPGGGVSDEWPRYRKALSRGGNVYARTLLQLPVRDLTGGFKMWTAPALASFDLAAADAAGYGFQIQTTLLAIQKGARVAETPILFVDRTLGTSKMSNGIIIEAMKSVLRLRKESQASRRAGFPAPPAALRVLPVQRTGGDAALTRVVA